MKPTWCVTALWTAVLVLGSTFASAQSGSLEPPSTAVNGSGDPVATTQTQPSWDQDLPVNERFKLVLGGEAVLDKETGLVWEQSPLGGVSTAWPRARSHCLAKVSGGKSGWRLPSIHELASLLDPTNTIGNLRLPLGHPFSNVQSSDYWSATRIANDIGGVWGLNFRTGGFSALEDDFNDFSIYSWCVRGGGPLSEY